MNYKACLERILRQIREIPPVPTVEYAGPIMSEEDWVKQEVEKIIRKEIMLCNAQKRKQ